MFDRIKKALDACGISDWRILETVSESYELFFVKKSLDTRRIKDTKKYTVTVFRKNTRIYIRDVQTCKMTELEFIITTYKCSCEIIAH